MIFLNSKAGNEQTETKKMRRGQSTLEYALIVAVVAAALTAMSLYLQRSVQGNLKLMEDKINAQPGPSD